MQRAGMVERIAGTSARPRREKDPGSADARDHGGAIGLPAHRRAGTHHSPDAVVIGVIELTHIGTRQLEDFRGAEEIKATGENLGLIIREGH